jgi:hypothetical protein
MAPGNPFRSEYLLLNIIPTASKSKRSATPLMALGALLVVGAGLIVMFGQ